MSTPINETLLPLKKGYIEIEENGIRRYKALDPLAEFLTDGYDVANACYVTITPPIETLRRQKLAEFSTATEQFIFAGIDVTTSFGTLHYPLTDRDQSYLALFKLLIAGGGAGWLYNANGQDHEFYSAADLSLIIDQGLSFVTYNRTYFSELRKWVARESDADVLSGIMFGSPLPEDLASDLSAKLALLSGG